MGVALPPVEVRFSRDNGSNWTEVTNSVKADGFNCLRGRSRMQGEWVPGTLQITFNNRAAAVDPSNDAATWQLRAGDLLGVRLDGYGTWYGRVDTAVITYIAAGSIPDSMMVVTATDLLGDVAAGHSAAIGSTTPDNSADVVTHTLAVSGVDYAGGVNIGTGAVDISNADYNPTSPPNPLQFLQKVTLTEGGASRLFIQRTGALKWLGRNHRPTTTISFGTGGIPMSDVKLDEILTDWSNQLTLVPGEHSDSFASTTAITIGVGQKTFTVASGLSDRLSVGAAVRIVSAAAGDYMTGIVVSYSGTSLTVDVNTASGSGSHSDWTLTTTEAHTTALTSSSTSITNGTGQKTFTVGSGLGITVPALVGIVSIGSANAMTGSVVSYSGTTLVVDISAASGSSTRTDWSIATLTNGYQATASDQQSYDEFYRWRSAPPVPTLHATRPIALAEARLRCAERAWPEQRISMVEVDLSHPDLTAGNLTSILTADIGDGASVKFARGVGTPSTLYQVRFIDAIEHVRTASTHRVRFYLGMVPTMDYTPTLTNVTEGNGVKTGVYVIRDGWCDWTVKFTLGTTSDVTGEVSVSLPVEAAAVDQQPVAAYAYDAGGGVIYPLGAFMSSTTTVKLNAVSAGGTYAVFTATSATIPFNWNGTTGAVLTVGGTYRVA